MKLPVRTRQQMQSGGENMKEERPENRRIVFRSLYTRSRKFQTQESSIILNLGYVRYINILTWLRVFQDKLLCLVLFSFYSSLFWARQKIETYYFDPKAPGGGGYSIYSWVGRCGTAPHILTLFKTNITDFPTLFKTEFRFFNTLFKTFNPNIN